MSDNLNEMATELRSKGAKADRYTRGIYANITEIFEPRGRFNEAARPALLRRQMLNLQDRSQPWRAFPQHRAA